MHTIANFDNLSLAEMEKLAARTAKILRGGDFAALYGDLGAGKSTFCRFLLRAMGVIEDIPSPTFTIVQNYDLAAITVWHCDLYRIQSPGEILQLGIIEPDQTAIRLIEWPEKMGRYLPDAALHLTLGFTADDNARSLTISGQGDWPKRFST